MTFLRYDVSELYRKHKTTKLINYINSTELIKSELIELKSNLRFNHNQFQQLSLTFVINGTQWQYPED